MTRTTDYSCILRKSNRQQGISPDCVSAQEWSLINNVDKTANASYERAKLELFTGEDTGSIGAGKPGEVGCMSSDPRTYDDAVSGVDAVGWRASTQKSARLYSRMIYSSGQTCPKTCKRSRRSFSTGGSTTRTECLVDRSREWWCKVSTRVTLGPTSHHQ